MSVRKAKALLSSLREKVRQNSIAHAQLDLPISEIQRELNERSAQDQRSLHDQLVSVQRLAIANGHYDAADWIFKEGIQDKELRAALTQNKVEYDRRHGRQ